MPDDRTFIYWDANVFLSYIDGDPARLPTLDAILADSANPESLVQIATSTLSIVEVAFAIEEKTKGVLDPGNRGSDQ